ncbi:ferredoxin reductase [Bauldia litoralis]|uniref:Ferredoxin-NADP reductase n=1 Tax=Bauldia litoralis TaxID=665467 RepID=A0A1G6AHB5_9HYPH|nr:ferredoxin reductase [Bauldia litoralis]SDB07785.1 Ferredoxin-NADP reductase [Bauldia litoralis]
MPPTRIAWQQATVTAIVPQTPTVKSYILTPSTPFDFVAGQHVDVRLTAPDGYQAERSYSIGSAPGGDTIELVIERLEDGEVSLFFHEVVEVGDAVEIRGPIGGHFNWSPSDAGPILLVGGGSGVVPLMSMLRRRAAASPDTPFALVYSARRWDEVIFRDEVMQRAREEDHFTLALTLTREASPVPDVRSGRIDRMMLADTLMVFGDQLPVLTFVCGATAFVEVATMLLIDLGVPFESIRTERYGGAEAKILGPDVAVPDA